MYLYLGLDPKRQKKDKKLVHLPLISTRPSSYSLQQRAEVIKELKASKRLLFTSRTAVDFFFSFLEKEEVKPAFSKKSFIAVGSATNERLIAHGIKGASLPSIPTQEGLMDWMDEHISSKEKGRIFWPCSTKARKNLSYFCKKRGWSLYAWPFYATCLLKLRSKPNLEQYEKVVFTSPTTVEAFCLNFGLDKLVDTPWEAIGPITQAYVEKRLEKLRKS